MPENRETRMPLADGRALVNEKRYQIRETDHPTLRYAVVDTWKPEQKPDPRYQSHAEAFTRSCFLNDHPNGFSR